MKQLHSEAYEVCGHTHNVADDLTRSLPKPAFHKHREFLHGTAKSFSVFYAAAHVIPWLLTSLVLRICVWNRTGLEAIRALKYCENLR
jgi:hypothetical protein